MSASPTGVDAEAVFDPTIQTKPKGMSLFKRKTKTPEPDPTPPESDVDTPRPQEEEGYRLIGMLSETNITNILIGWFI